MKIKNILLTTDFSKESRRAYPTAAHLARAFGAQIHLVHAAELLPPFIFSSQGFGGGLTHAEYLEDIGKRLKEEAEGRDEFEDLIPRPFLITDAPAVKGLHEFEKEHDIDLTVLSTHGRTGIGYAFLGSFAQKVVRTMSSPVLTCRARDPGAEIFDPKRVLVPFDFSENSRAVLPVVHFLAENFLSEFVFLYVMEPIYPVLDDTVGSASYNFLQRSLDEAPAKLRSQFSRLQQDELSGIHATLDVMEGNAAHEIVRKAMERDRDLVLLATHGWSGFKHFLLGSVAEFVVRASPCPVLTIRSPTQDSLLKTLEEVVHG